MWNSPAYSVLSRDRHTLWEIGDAILAECGVPSEDGVNDGSRAKLQAAGHLPVPPGGPRGTPVLGGASTAGSPENLKAIIKAARGDPSLFDSRKDTHRGMASRCEGDAPGGVRCRAAIGTLINPL
jgi:hypothetical protein